MTTYLRFFGLWACLCPWLLSCMTRPVETPPLKIDTTNYQEIPQTLEKDIDILFVIDNSGSMAEEQENLIRNFDKFIDALRMPQLDGKLPNVRIGVTTTDLGVGQYSNFRPCDRRCGDGGKLIATSSTCPVQLPSDEPWISYTVDGDGVASTNLDVAGAPGLAGDAVAQVKEAFSCIANVGIAGCGFEMQMEASLWALSPAGVPAGVSCPDLPDTGRQPQNPGFLRPHAFLAVVYITDEDDCSGRSDALYNNITNPDPVDPDNNSLTSPLGPWQSYRCFEFGIDCTGFTAATPIGTAQGESRYTPAVYENCTPTTTKVITGTEHPWLTPVQEYVSFFSTLKSRPERVILFGIAGPLPENNTSGLCPPGKVCVDIRNRVPTLMPSCAAEDESGGFADPAIRLASMIEGFARVGTGHFNRGLTTTGEEVAINICSIDYSSALRKLGRVIVATLGAQCISQPLLTQRGGLACQSGLPLGGGESCTEDCLDEVACQVADIVGQYSEAALEIPIAKCLPDRFDPQSENSGTCDPCPCWRIVAAPDRCDPTSVGSPYGLEILRRQDPEPGTVAKVFCHTTDIAWTDTDALLAIGQCAPPAATTP